MALAVFAPLVLVSACASTPPNTTSEGSLVAVRGAPPPGLLGAFDDDYGNGPTISASRWRQGAGTSYLPIAWHPAAQYLVARNAPSNMTAPGRYTRIDWMRLDGAAPWEWAYCLSAFDAPTADAAEAVQLADRTQPRTGCNGFPFTRLKRRIP